MVEIKIETLLQRFESRNYRLFCQVSAPVYNSLIKSKTNLVCFVSQKARFSRDDEHFAGKLLTLGWTKMHESWQTVEYQLASHPFISSIS